MLLFTVFAGLTGPFNSLILRRELGATPFQFSLLAAGHAVCLLLSIALTRAIDTRRPLAWVVWPAFVARSLFLLVPFIYSPGPFVGILVAGTLMATVAGPAQAALVQRIYPPTERGRALGAIRVAGSIVAALIAVVAGHVMGWLSYRLVFAGAGVLGMAASLRLLWLPVPAVAPEARAARPGFGEAWHAIRQDAPYRRLLVAAFVFGTGDWIMRPATPLLLADVVRVTTAQMGMFAAAAAAAALVGNLIWGRLADRHSSLRALHVVFVVGTLTPLAYYVAARVAPLPSVLVVATITETLLATGLDFVWMLVVIDFAGPRRTTQYAAIALTLGGVRGVICPFVGAVIIQSVGVHAVYLVAAAFMAAGVAFVGRELRNQKAPRYVEEPRLATGAVVPSGAALNLS
jgi:predicted MFS family arabinose efflux permease